MQTINSSFQTETGMQVLAELLDRLRMYGRERQIEDILRVFDVPAMHPSTVVLVGPPESCPARFLAGFTGLLAGQSLPIAQVICTPASQETPNSLLLALLSDFFKAYSRARLLELMAPQVKIHRWLAWYFPVLRNKADIPPSPPDDATRINRVLETVLHIIVRTQPHLAIIHHLHGADAASLSSLHALQVMKRQGLRLLASADPAEGRRFPAWSTFDDGTPVTITLPRLTPMKLRHYLAEISPELTSNEVVEHLLRISGGQPLLLETMLRAWAIDGILTQHDAGWSVTPLQHTKGRVEFSGISPALESVLDHLAQAALVGATTRAFLSILWSMPPDKAALMITAGRLLGYLAAPSAEDPESVEVVDLDHQDSLRGRLTVEQQEQIQRIISALREDPACRQQQQSHASACVEWPGEIGAKVVTDPFFAAILAAVSRQFPKTDSQESLPDFCRFTWCFKAPAEVDNHALKLLMEAVHAIRLTGIQCRLYPPTSRLIIEYADAAIAALNRLFAERSSLTITSDGETLALDGKTIISTDHLAFCQDYRLWMAAGDLQAIGVARGVHAQELLRFLTILVTHEPVDGYQALLEQVAGLHLNFIQLLSWHQLLSPTASNSATYARLQPVFTHREILGFLAETSQR